MGNELRKCCGAPLLAEHLLDCDQHPANSKLEDGFDVEDRRPKHINVTKVRKVRKPAKLTKAQRVMRKEMEAGPEGKLHGRAKGVMSLGDVFDEVVGPEQTLEGELAARVPMLALEVIDKHDLVLSLGQWQTVQTMVEQGVLAGIEAGKGLRA